MAGGILSGLGAGLAQAGGTFGRALSSLKTPAERERERLQNQALLQKNRLGQVSLDKIDSASLLAQRQAEEQKRLATGAGDLIGGFQKDLSQGQDIANRRGIFLPTINQLGTPEAETAKDTFNRQESLGQDVQGGALPSQLFKERLVSTPFDIAQRPEVGTFIKTLEQAEPRALSESEKLKNQKLEAEISNFKLKRQKLQTEIEQAENENIPKPRPLKNTIVKEITSLDQTIKNVKNALELYNRNFVGMEEKVLANLAEKTTGLTKQEVEFRTIMQKVKNELIKLRSGVAVNPEELKRIDAEIGDFNVRPEVFTERLKTNLFTFNRRRTDYLDNLEKANFNIKNFTRDLVNDQNTQNNNNEFVDTATSQAPIKFNSVEEAENANLPVGTKIIINGESATIR